MKRCLVTTSRDRPVCFSILEQWIANQSLQPDTWLVVNDSDHPEEYRYTMGQKVILRTDEGLSQHEKDLPSICKNWLAAIPHLSDYDIILIAEDDDYYSPDCLKTLDGMLNNAELAGISEDVYYSLPKRKAWRMRNQEHASLSASAFRIEIIEGFERCCKVFKSVFIDMYLWAEIGQIWEGRKALYPQPLYGKKLHVGMKNMPGAAGLGTGHANSYMGWIDPHFQTLREWIGNDCQVYRELYNKFFS